ncbi:MAG: DUF983 domain-containing protein [Saprospiraceae bacterium]|nr:DUF983 domain-containing protein [Saprospiraceae bacterium]MBP7680081.1 DUF983 domain-containing protein [Saprospiraceae bacterium]
MGKGTKLYGIWNLKCPRCHEGDLFPTATLSFKQPFDMNEECPKCGLNFFPEPGYYFGSMFISYIWTGMFSVLVVVLLHWVLGLSLDMSFLILVLLMALMFVWIFRVSRAIWINLLVKYEG